MISMKISIKIVKLLATKWGIQAIGKGQYTLIVNMYPILSTPINYVFEKNPSIVILSIKPFTWKKKTLKILLRTLFLK